MSKKPSAKIYIRGTLGSDNMKICGVGVCTLLIWLNFQIMGINPNGSKIQWPNKANASNDDLL
jgi:hypothetical protein